MKHNNITCSLLFLAICVFAFLGTKTWVMINPTAFASNYFFDFHEEGGFYIGKGYSHWLGSRIENDVPRNSDIGPLPDGKFISGYIKEGIGSYLIPSTNYLHYKDRNGKDYSVPISSYSYKNYNYTATLLVYDVSDQMSLYGTEKLAYDGLMNQLKEKLESYNYELIDPFAEKKYFALLDLEQLYRERNKLLYYDTFSRDSVKSVRKFYFANKKAYVYEVQSEKKAYVYGMHSGHEEPENILPYLTTIDFSKYKKSIIFKIVSCYLLSVLLAIIFTHLMIRSYRRRPLVNYYADKLKKYTLLMTVLNLLVSIMLLLFGNLIHVKHINVYLSISLMTLIFMNLPIYIYLYRKSKKKYQYDYLIQDRVNSYFTSRLGSDKGKKTLLSLLYYPLFVIGVIPFGVLCLIFIIPFSIIIILMLEIRHLYRWINKDEMSSQQDAIEFVDYYVVLDLKLGASKNEIEMAYDSAIAKYKSNSSSPLYGQQFFRDIQEAYAVLSSINQLRPEYDKEYLAYKNSNHGSFNYNNQLLKHEIAKIRYRINNGGNL